MTNSDDDKYGNRMLPTMLVIGAAIALAAAGVIYVLVRVALAIGGALIG